MSVSAIEGVILEGGDVVLMARVTGASGDPITQATVSSISWECWKRDIPEGKRYPASTTTITPTKTGAGTGVVATNVFDTLQTDDRWTKDATGYNFALQIAASHWPTTDISTFPDSGWARAEVKFYMADGSICPIFYDNEVIASLFGKV